MQTIAVLSRQRAIQGMYRIVKGKALVARDNGKASGGLTKRQHEQATCGASIKESLCGPRESRQPLILQQDEGKARFMDRFDNGFFAKRDSWRDDYGPTTSSVKRLPALIGYFLGTRSSRAS